MFFSLISHSSLKKFFLNHVFILFPLLLEPDVKNIAKCDNEEFTIYVFYYDFTVSSPTFRSLIYFELIFVYNVK